MIALQAEIAAGGNKEAGAFPSGRVGANTRGLGPTPAASRRSKGVIAPQAGRQEMFLRSKADIAIYGGAAGGGKTFSLLMEPLYHTKNPRFGAIIFRQTYPQITNKGGLWDESFEVYAKLNPAPKPKAGSLEWVWPSGATVGFRHMDREETKLDYQGAQIPLIGWDQLEQFTESQFFFMLSRNRSNCGVRPYVRGTANPQPGWLADFLDWWIDEDGYAIPERVGVLRYFIRVGNRIVWGDAPEPLRVEYGGVSVEPKSVTFIPSSVYDNPILLASNPGYLANLMSLPTTERMRLLGDPVRGGNWKVRAGGTKFKREWFEVVDSVPAELDSVVRFWDLASTAPKPGTDPDWTAGVKLGVKDGVFYVLDVRRTRQTPHGIERFIRATALEDGWSVPVRIEEEGGSSGKATIDSFQRRVLLGFDFRGVRSTGSKEIRANPVSSAAEAGNVKIVRGPWVSELLDELESFSPVCEHDDQVDALSGAFQELSSAVPGHISAVGQDDPGTVRILNTEIEKLLAELSPDERMEADELLDRV